MGEKVARFLAEVAKFLAQMENEKWQSFWQLWIFKKSSQSHQTQKVIAKIVHFFTQEWQSFWQKWQTWSSLFNND